MCKKMIKILQKHHGLVPQAFSSPAIEREVYLRHESMEPRVAQMWNGKGGVRDGKICEAQLTQSLRRSEPHDFKCYFFLPDKVPHFDFGSEGQLMFFLQISLIRRTSEVGYTASICQPWAICRGVVQKVFSCIKKNEFCYLLTFLRGQTSLWAKKHET